MIENQILKLKPKGLVEIVSLFYSNKIQQKSEKRFPSVCIWGKHGMGKSAIAKYLKKTVELTTGEQLGFIYLSPEQLSEEGDLLGFPEIKDGRMHYATPAWVKTDEKFGILLIDDFNRANPDIIKALKEIIYNGKSVAWSIPKDWLIVLTANPTDGDYSVSEIDDALLTRMANYEMLFDPLYWASYANSVGYDSLFISFVTKHGTQLFGRKGDDVIRSYTQFLDTLKGFDWKSNIDLTMDLARGFMSEKTVILLEQHLTSILSELPSATDIISKKDKNEVINCFDSFFSSFSSQKEGYTINDVFFYLAYSYFGYLNANASKCSLDDAKKLLAIVDYEHEGHCLAADFWDTYNNSFFTNKDLSEKIKEYIISFDKQSILNAFNI